MNPYKRLLHSAFTIELNANDFFAYACAWSLTVYEQDVFWMIPIIEKYEDDGINACMAYIQNQEPIKPWHTDKFKEAIEELKALKPEVLGDSDYSDHYNSASEVYRKVKTT